jgi:hypothetical protein
MPRTILIHLNVEAPDDDPRTFVEIEEAVKGALEVGSDDPSLDGLTIEVTMAEEI